MHLDRRRRAARDDRYKLITRRGAKRELYVLDGDYVEGEDLMEGKLSPEAREALKALLAELPR